MNNFEPFEFDNFIIKDKEEVAFIDLSVNKAPIISDANSAKALELIDAQLKKLLELEHKDNIAMLKTLLQKLSPVLLQKHSLDIVADFVEKNFFELKKQKTLDFYLHPDVIHNIKEKIHSLASYNQYEGQIFLHKDLSLKPYECKITWQNNKIQYDSNKIVAEIVSLLEKGF